MAAPIVYSLEVVEVEHRHDERLLRALGPGVLEAESVIPNPAIGKPRQRVGSREVVQPLKQPAALQGGAHLRGQEADGGAEARGEGREVGAPRDGKDARGCWT